MSQAQSPLWSGDIPDLDRLRAVARDIADSVLRTPLWRNEVLSDELGAQVSLKMENLQRTGSFKVRGATNVLRRLLETRTDLPGVVALSAGNHAQGVARAASRVGIAATVVMPLSAPLTKIESCRRMGAEVVLSGETIEQAKLEADRIAEERGYAFLHPYDDWNVIAGQASCGIEMLEDCPQMSVAIVPLGGGGLLSGIALALKLQRPDIRVIGVQAENVSPFRSFLKDGTYAAVAAGAHTIADGIKVKAPGRLSSAVIARYVDEIVTVDDNAIAEAIVATLERTRTISEGAGAVGLAALMHGKVKLSSEDHAVVVVSGGNVDMPLVGRSIDYGLASSGRLMSVGVTIPDSPGHLLNLLRNVAALGINVRHVEHRRGELHVPVGQCEVVLEVETRNLAHQQELLTQFAEQEGKVRCLFGD
ncbi:threonine ammonia-lyase [Niveibacterium terrae]|uniref:threonine ammonia-lyase n=1 Tax=Niveibacterium terrae TaxID=3373598 RepID=UPI003A8F9993